MSDPSAPSDLDGQAMEITRWLCPRAGQPDHLSCRICARVAPRLARLLREAKVSALRDVAKAGCAGRRGEWGDLKAVPVHGYHESATTQQRTGCRRPEVWDALASLSKDRQGTGSAE